MTDRIHALTVVLDHDMRDDDPDRTVGQWIEMGAAPLYNKPRPKPKKTL